LTPEQIKNADRDEIQRAMSNLGKHVRISTDNQEDETRFGVHGADGQFYEGVSAYIGRSEEGEDGDDEMSTIHEALSQAGSVTGSATRVASTS
jgi:hypothetical protein